MDYQGRYAAFDASRIRTYPVAGRPNKVTLDSLVDPAAVEALETHVTAEAATAIEQVADAIVEARARDRAVICFTGAHLIKNGLGPLLADLVERGAVTLVAGNAAVAIHDFELALFGQTSENVPAALPEGRFGMAFEFAYVNGALTVGDAMNLGFGESLGRAMHDAAFRRQVEDALAPLPRERTPLEFAHPEVSVLARAYARAVPMCICAGVGTDVIDQHPSFDGRAKGGCSGRDFLVYTREAMRLAGGVVLNIGSAVTGPEVLLKAISMVSNVGRPPTGLVAADFDLRPYRAEDMSDEARYGYYYRDQKSVVTRVPASCDGRGYYVQGDQRDTLPALYRALTQRLGGTS